MVRKMKIKLIISVAFLVIFYIFLSPLSSEWSYIKCLEKCNDGVNVPYESCRYQIIQKLIDHGKCWWSDMTPLN